MGPAKRRGLPVAALQRDSAATEKKIRFASGDSRFPTSPLRSRQNQYACRHGRGAVKSSCRDLECSRQPAWMRRRTPRLCRLPAYAPDLNPAEGIWSLLKRAMVNFAAADVDGLARIIKRKLKKIQYQPHLIDGCLAATGLTIEPW